MGLLSHELRRYLGIEWRIIEVPVILGCWFVGANSAVMAELGGEPCADRTARGVVQSDRATAPR